MNERANLPSASSAHRYALCPGSFLLEQQAPPEETNEDAELGHRIHAWLASDPIQLSPDELELAERCREQAHALIQEHMDGGHGQTVREERIWAFDDDFAKSWSGKPDLVVHNSTRAIVIDFKTGRGDVEDSVNNLQLRALAVLVADQYAVEWVTVAIVQPHAGPPSVCHYGPDCLTTATIEVSQLMRRVLQPNHPRIPSAAACQYCRAKSICPEAQATVNTLPTLVTRQGREITMTGEQIARFLELAPVAEDAIEAVRALAKRRLGEDPGAVPGWGLKPGAERQTITDPEAVFGRFSAIGGTSQQFIRAVKVVKAEFKAAVREATGRKGRELDETIDGILDGLTETKTTAPSLVREKGTR
jgi:CRISPR/Cas system-associated exonuclease Cas4 (RecB family)